MVVRRKKAAIQNGAGFFDFVKKANKFIRDNKIISRTAGAVSAMAPPGSKIGTAAEMVNAGSSATGYGRRRGKKQAGGSARAPVRAPVIRI